MTPFGNDARPTVTNVTNVVDPAGTVGFGSSVEHDKIGSGWSTWSHGYVGDVYWTHDGIVSLTLTMPAGTNAFYFYAEPVSFATFNVTATAQDGSTSGALPVNGFAGARYFGFYGTNGAKVESITISSPNPPVGSDFAVGEFGIAVQPPPPPKLTVVKDPTNNNGGNAKPDDFALKVGGNPVPSGVASTLNANTPYSINETQLAGYTFVSITGSPKCPSVLGGTITLAPGDDITCTITNDDVAPKLTVVKDPTNDNGGNAKPDDFALTVGGNPVPSGVASTLNANTPYSINETQLAGYTFVSITGSPKCPSVLGGTITLAPGDDITCTITNDDVAPKLTVVKDPTNDNGGNAKPDDFALTVGGNPVPSGVASTLNANVPYSINETQLAGYTFVSITGSPKCPSVLGGTITLAPGDDITCTITNDDVPPPPPQERLLTELSDVHVWVGLRNSDDQGTQFDVQTELLQNGTPVASGLTRCVTNVTRNPTFATEVVVPWNDFQPVPVGSGDVFELRVSTRVGTVDGDGKCSGPGGSHNSAVGLRLYYDAANLASQFDVTITPDPNRVLYLHSDGTGCGDIETPGVTKRTLDGYAAGDSSPKCKDSAVVNFAGGNAWQVIGVWSMAPQP